MKNLTISTIDVIIPCYNVANTLERTVLSVINQTSLGKIWLIDDGSSDETWSIIMALKARFDGIICAERFEQNKGVATARNIGAMLSGAQYVAFLDADDVYQSQVLEACAMVFERYQTGLIRLPMIPRGMPSHFSEHPNFDVAWRTFEMTAASNTVFNRSYFLALGGFDTHEVFRRLGGEDGALGLATIETTQVITLFDNPNFAVAVEYHCHESMYVKHLLNALLFDKHERHIGEGDIQIAHRSTNAKVQQMLKLQTITAKHGKLPVVLS